MIFRDNRQQSQDNLEKRDMIMRHVFFSEYSNLPLKDSKRSFNESERIAIYRRDKGLCKICLDEGKSEVEATVPWSQYDADHIKAWITGGKTSVEQAQVLCRYHNRQKSDKLLA